MKKFGLGKISLFVMSLLLVFSFFGNVAFAVDKIHVEYPVGTNMNGDDIFDAENILPGWSETKTVKIKNRSTTDAVNLYFTFDIEGNEKLARKLKLYVIRKKDNSYRIGGQGDRYTLKKADDEGTLYVDKLNTTQGKEYKIKIKFDEDAGNEYQDLKTKFDIDFRIEAKIAEDGTTESAAAILADEGRVVTGNPPAEEVQGVDIDNGELQTVGGQETETLGVAGTSKDCQSWPRWVWILALIIFTLNFGRNAWKNWEDEKYKWIFPLAWTILAVAFWYFFDKCQEFQWFLQASIIIAIVLHFSYLYYLRKKVSQVEVKTEIE